MCLYIYNCVIKPILPVGVLWGVFINAPGIASSTKKLKLSIQSSIPARIHSCTFIYHHVVLFTTTESTLLPMMWTCLAVVLLWLRPGGCTDKANTSDLIEYTTVDFYEKLHSGKMMFIYFEYKGRRGH